MEACMSFPDNIATLLTTWNGNARYTNKFHSLIRMTPFCISILSLLSSCGTIRQQPYEKVNIQSNPVGAHITIDGYSCGVTPAEVELDSRYSHSVVVEKEYFPTQKYILKSKQSMKKMVSNLLFPIGGGAVGFGVGLACASSLAPFEEVLIVLSTAGGIAVGSFLGVVSTGVDLYSGATRTLSDHEINVDLLPPEFR